MKGYGDPHLAYYQGYHPTSRFFDRLVNEFFQQNDLFSELGGTWLEVGAGRGRLSSLGRSARRVYLDISSAMLSELEDSEADCVLASALRLPFRGGTFDLVLSILGDAFNRPEFFLEASRVLKTGGRLIHVVPAREWGEPLRAERGLPSDVTSFVGSSGVSLRAPSFLADKHQLQIDASAATLRVADIRALSVQVADAIGVPDVMLPFAADSSIRELPILWVLQAVKAA